MAALPVQNLIAGMAKVNIYICKIDFLNLQKSVIELPIYRKITVYVLGGYKIE